MKRLLFLFLLGSLFMQVSAQVTDYVPARNYQLAPVSPAATQFGKYDHLPVSEYTGNPEVSVPIYTISVDGLEIPLTLSYQGGGIRVNQEASWVGLGWDLSVAAIVQVVNDIDDFATGNYNVENANRQKKILPDWIQGESYTYQPYPAPANHYSNMCMPYSTNPPVITSPDGDYAIHLMVGDYFSISGVRNPYPYLHYAPDRTFAYDSEPDVFKVNLMGESLSIVSDFKANSFAVLNKKGYTVVCDRNNKKWTITTPDKHVFEFNRYVDTNTESYSNLNSTQVGRSVGVTSRTWVVTKITTCYGNVVDFDYNQSGTQHSILTQHQALDYPLRQISMQALSLYAQHCVLHSGSLYNQIANLSTTSTSREYPIVLSRITFPGGRLEFTTSSRQDITAGYKLDKVSLRTTGGVEKRAITFVYDYFIEKSGGKRLKLLSLTNGDQKYSFGYDPKQLPARNSFEQDYWGFNNGQTANRSMVPNASRFNSAYSAAGNGNNMSARLSFARSAILNEVTYPTGGKACFTYELNQFNNYWVPDSASTTNTVSNGMGVRVKKIEYKNHDGTTLKTTSYTYEEGKAILANSPVQEFYRTIMASSNKYEMLFLACSTTGNYASNPLHSFSGVGYGKVTRYETAATPASGERTVTTYFNYPDKVPTQQANSRSVMSYTQVPSTRDINGPVNGSINSVTQYNDGGQIVKQTTHTYRNVASPLYYGARVAPYGNYYHYNPPGNPSPSGAIYIPAHTVALYPIRDFETLLTKRVEKEYFNGNVTETSWNYEYNANNRVSKVKTMNGVIDYRTENITYDGTLISEPNMVEALIQDPYKIVRNWTTNTYNHRVIASEQKSVAGSAHSGNNLHTTTFNLYNSKGKLRQKTDQDGLVTTYLWGFASQQLVAEIKGATYSQVEAALGGSTYVNQIENAAESNPQWAKLNQLRSGLSNVLITTWNYNPLVGVTESMSPNSISTYYTYNTAGRLTEIYRMEGSTKQVIQRFNYNFK